MALVNLNEIMSNARSEIKSSFNIYRNLVYNYGKNAKETKEYYDTVKGELLTYLQLNLISIAYYNDCLSRLELLKENTASC